MVLKTIKLQGKEYVQVQERIKYFRENYSEGRIETEYNILDGRVIFKAFIYDGDKLVATGTGMKDTAKEFELEKAETRSIGRALAIAGIGIDAGIASYDEIRDFHSQNKEKQEVIGNVLKDDTNLILEFNKLITSKEYDYDKFISYFAVSKVADILDNPAKLKEAVEQLRTKPNKGE